MEQQEAKWGEDKAIQYTAGDKAVRTGLKPTTSLVQGWLDWSKNPAFSHLTMDDWAQMECEALPKQQTKKETKTYLR